MIVEPTKEEVEFAKKLEKDAIEHYEEDKKATGVSLVDIAKTYRVKLWRLIGAMWELDKKFHLEVGKAIPLAEADKIFLKWGLYRIMDEEITRLKREKWAKKLLELLV